MRDTGSGASGGCERLYELLWQVNRAVVRSPGPQALLDDVCRIAVECGGFSRAWAGRVDRDARAIRPLAARGAGGAAERIDGIALDGAGPSNPVLGKVLGREAYVCNDLAADPATLSGRPHAAPTAHAAYAALPLTARGAVSGVLAFYAAESGFFDAERMRLLALVAEDVSFALDRFESKTLQEQAERALQRSETRYRALIEHIPAVTYIASTDDPSKTSYFSPQSERMLGIGARELHDNPQVWVERLHPEDRERVLAELERSRLGGLPFVVDYRMIHRDGHTVWIRDHGAFVPTGEAGKTLLQGVMLDVTEQKLAAQALEQKAALTRLLDAMASTAGDAVDSEVALRLCLEQLCGYLGWPIGHLVVLPWSDGGDRGRRSIWHLADAARYRPFMEATDRGPSVDLNDGFVAPMLATRRPAWTTALEQTVGTARARAARETALSTGFAFPVTVAGEPIAYLEFMTGERIAPNELLLDSIAAAAAGLGRVVERLRANAALAASEKKLADILAALNDVVWSVSADTHAVLYVSPAAERLYGRPARDFIDDPGLWLQMVHPEDRSRINGYMPVLQSEGRADFEYRIVRPDGEVRWLHDRGWAVRDGAGRVLRYDGIASDVTERKRTEERIAYLAQHDALTGLPNRVLLRDRLRLAMARAERNERLLAVLFLDLDRFKEINETLGHEAGDAAMREMVARLQCELREVDTIARWAGDEFVILLEDIVQVDRISTVAQKVLDLSARPLMVGEHEVFISCSIGIVLYPFDIHDADQLLKSAEIAMHKAKRAGRNTYEFYDPGKDARTPASLDLESRLRHALERGQFALHYQPQVGLKSGLVVGVEALLRWDHPALGPVPPARFIPLAEESGLIVPIGAWVLETACRQAQAWRRRGLPPLRVAVNLSARQFRQKGLIEMIERVLRDTGLEPGNLELELTESTIVHHEENTLRLLDGLDALGVQLAVDDFGTGYSNLAYLKRFPLDRLKIDQAFVRDIVTDEDDRAVVRAIVAMARGLGLATIAEGVETDGQRAFLAAVGCDDYQGYLYSPPLPADKVERLLV